MLAASLAKTQQKKNKKCCRSQKKILKNRGIQNPTLRYQTLAVARSRFVFCNFCFSVLTFSYSCFDIFVIFSPSVFGVCCLCARMKVVPSAVGSFPPKSIAGNSIFPQPTKVWESFLHCHYSYYYYYICCCSFIHPSSSSFIHSIL